MHINFRCFYLHHVKVEGQKIPYSNFELITDIEEVGYSGGEIERMAQDRRRWRTVVGGLCPGRV